MMMTHHQKWLSLICLQQLMLEVCQAPKAVLAVSKILKKAKRVEIYPHSKIKVKEVEAQEEQLKLTSMRLAKVKY